MFLLYVLPNIRADEVDELWGLICFNSTSINNLGSKDVERGEWELHPKPSSRSNDTCGALLKHQPHSNRGRVMIPPSTDSAHSQLW